MAGEKFHIQKSQYIIQNEEIMQIFKAPRTQMNLLK